MSKCVCGTLLNLRMPPSYLLHLCLTLPRQGALSLAQDSMPCSSPHLPACTAPHRPPLQLSKWTPTVDVQQTQRATIYRPHSLHFASTMTASEKTMALAPTSAPHLHGLLPPALCSAGPPETAAQPKHLIMASDRAKRAWEGHCGALATPPEFKRHSPACGEAEPMAGEHVNPLIQQKSQAPTLCQAPFWAPAKEQLTRSSPPNEAGDRKNSK